MARELVVCQRTDACHSVAEQMREHNVGMLPVMQGDRVVGVVTDRDLAIRHLAQNPGRVAHRSVVVCMTPEVVAIGPDAKVSEATHVMRSNGVRRLLVMEKGRLQGIVTLDDITSEVGRLAGAALVVQQALAKYYAPRKGTRESGPREEGLGVE